MVIEGKLALVEQKDIDFYNTLPKVITDLYDECFTTMEDLKRVFSEYYPDQFDLDTFLKR